MIDKSLLRVANTDDTEFLLQPELNAIKQGLQYKEVENKAVGKYKGYVNQLGQQQGVGIRITDIGQNQKAEFRQNKLHGTAKVTDEDGNTYWGEFKDGNKEGYGTCEYADGSRYIGQWMQGDMHGYGIYRWAHGAVY